MKFSIKQTAKEETYFNFFVQFQFASDKGSYFIPSMKFNITIDECDIEQFIKELRIINHYSGRKYIHLVKNYEMFIKYFQPSIDIAIGQYPNNDFEGYYPDKDALTFVNEFGISCPIEIEWSNSDNAKFEFDKSHLKTQLSSN